MAGTFEDDFRWQERFRGHFSEIVRLVCKVEVAPPVDDWKWNTDFILTTTKNRITFSGRARRAKYTKRYADNFSIRLRRPLGAKTEMDKLLNGHGDMLIHGFESATYSDRLRPWLLGDLDVLRQYLRDGGHYEPISNDDGTIAAYFYLADMPPEFIVESEGLPFVDRDCPWQQCSHSNCEGRWVPPDRGNARFVVACDDDLLGPGRGRRCTFCDRVWRAGWVMPETRGSEPPRLAG